jgi:hypothetical protein
MRIRSFAVALALTLAFSAGAANADVALTFNDLSDTTSVTVSGGSATVVSVTPEDMLVILPAGTLAPGAVVPNSVYGLIEPGTTGFSDLIYFSAIPNTTALLVEFVSNTDDTPLIPAIGFTLYGSAVETGLVQTIPLPPGVSGVTVAVQSGLEAIPEPSILALAGTGGFLGLGFWGYRRRKA